MKFNLLFLFTALILQLNAQFFPSQKSILSEGQIFKLSVQKAGVYKIAKKQLDDLGINTSSLNPKTLKLYSNYGGVLPEAIIESYPDDFIELPIIVSGEGDGRFDADDYILFYSEGPDKWKYEASEGDYHFEKNIYSDFHYVFLKIDGAEGKRINDVVLNDIVPTLSLDKYTAYEVLHDDKYNLLGQNLATHGSGKLWVGDYLVSNQDKDVTSAFNFSNVDISQAVKFQINTVVRSENQGKVTFSVDGKNTTGNFSPVSYTATEDTYARQVRINNQSLLSSKNPKLLLRHSGNDGWLDFLSVISTKSLTLENGIIWIREKSLSGHNYTLLNFAGSINRCWDVSDLSEIKQYAVKNSRAVIATNTDRPQFILFDENASLTPTPVGKIANQNLHGIENIDMVILYHSTFKNAAEKLAQHRELHSKYKVSAIDVNLIYNEFGFGKLDPSAIRNFAKMIYERNPNFKYLLLIGDGSYDYKQLVKNVPNQNWIPVYESDESLDPVNAFPTDDYYALLSNNEGASLRGALDINVGRLTVNSVDEADALVKKIIDYDISPSRFGEWRLNSAFSADDEDGGSHMTDAENVAKESFIRDPLYNQQKVYLDAYQQENTPGGERYPDATDAINQNLEKGQLTWSYLGHGGPKGLAQERVVKLSDIESWGNSLTPTLFITATCSFAGYDDPSITSGGELALVNPTGGAIGLLTTVRSVYANENFRLTSNVYKNLFKKEKGLGLTLGEIIRSAKNATYADTTGDNTRKFTLLGDPSQRLATPEHNIVLTKINGIDATVFADTISALEKITLEGEVRDYNSILVSDFNGDLNLTMFDKISSLTTLSNDSNSPKKSFDVYKNIIFKGQAKIVNGRFTIEYFIPKDINYKIGASRMSFYANNGSTDAAGFYSKLVVGGSTITGVKDDSPPKMRLYMNDEQFVYGGITDTKPSLLIKLEDDYGINITGNSIGHDITAILTGEALEETYVLNNFYKAESNNYQKGEVRFPLSALKPGVYKVNVKAWDISNNSVDGIIEFRVIDEDNDKLERVINYPNPFVNQTNFSFEHDLVNTDIVIRVNIYTISGKLVKTIADNQYASGYRISDIKWDGKDDFGSNLARGVYLYQIVVNSPSLNLRRQSGFNKIVRL